MSEDAKAWRKAFPEAFDIWFAGIRARNQEKLQELADLHGWDIDERTGEPLPPWQEFSFFELDREFNGNATMAHVMHRAGVFKSVSEARKNGWNKPLQFGDFVVTKKKIRIRIDC